MPQLDYERRPFPPTTDTFLAGGIVFWATLHRINEERVGYRAEYNSPIARPFRPADAIGISTLCERVGAGRIRGINLPGSSGVFRAGSIFGIRLESALMEGESIRVARMRGRAHISAGNLIPDFGQFRATLQSASHFLADKEVVAFGDGYYRICPLREALSQIADLLILTDGMTNPNGRIAKLALGPAKSDSIKTDIL